MKGNGKNKVWRGLTGVSAVLLSALIGGTGIANANAGFINNALHTSNYEKVEVSGSNVADATYYKSAYTSLSELIADKEDVAERISEEGSVLLKNNGALPIDKASETVTLWGLNSHTPTLGGMIGSSAAANGEGQVLYGIEEALAEKGFTVNEQMKAFYASDAAMAYARRGFGNTGHGLSPSFGMIYENPKSYQVGEVPASLYTQDLLASADNTTAVVVISRDSSEAADYHPDMTNGTSGDSFTVPLALSAYEQEMIELAKAHSTKVIVLINADNPMEIETLKNDSEIDSILWVGAPGALGFLGVADVLSGDANPSGGLSDTYAVSSVSSPAMQNFGVYMYSNYSGTENSPLTSNDKGDWYVVESEGIYVGYKYYETRYADLINGTGNASSTAGAISGASSWNYADEVSYPFGYGLSYTTFSMTLDSVNVTIGGTGVATVTVTNTGDVAGKTPVQLYVQAPYTQGGLEKAGIQLVDFAKTDVLEPGQSQTVTIEFDPAYIASYSEDTVKENGTQGAWVIEEGDYYFAVGNGSHAALNNILAFQGVEESKLVKTSEEEAIDSDAAKKWTNAVTDIETYSVNVENALQDADLNNLIENAVEYTTRADWTKGWKEYTDLEATEEMLVGLTNSTYALTENGTGVTWGAANGLNAADFLVYDEAGNFTGVVDYDDPMWDDLIEQITLEEAAKYIEQAGDKTLEALTSINLDVAYWYDGPVGISNDQRANYYTGWTEADQDEPTYVAETDEYADYSLNTMPTEPVVGATFNKELVKEEGAIFGEDSLWTNTHSLAGPGLNLHRSPYCARNHEYYSEDSQLTNLMGAAVCEGSLYTGIMMMPKHFAFNHQEANRSGVSTFFNEQAGRELELRCFQEALSNNYAKGVMTGFNRIGTQFSGGYEGTQVQILRNEWGYTGWVVTDMINGADYMNWRDVVFGGGGGCLTTSAYENSEIGSMTSEANLALIAKDTAFQEKMQEILKHFVQTTISSNAMNEITSSTRLVYRMTGWQKILVGIDVVFGVLTAGCAVMYVVTLTKKNSAVK